jgi:hypothetical protein
MLYRAPRRIWRVRRTHLIAVRRDDQRGIRMSGKYPLLNELDSSLSGVITSEPVAFAGAWQPSTRRTYRDPMQHGSGTGALVEVVDVQWTGSLTSAVPIVCVGFLLTRDLLFWIKSAPAAVSQPVTVSLSAYADHSLDRATFALDKATLVASVGGEYLPGVPVPCAGDLSQACTLGVAEQFTGHVSCLAGAHDVSFLALILPGSVVKVGRNRLWHLRDTFAPLLSLPVRELLTRRRSGSIPANA